MVFKAYMACFIEDTYVIVGMEHNIKVIKDDPVDPQTYVM
jgi:hypothetical protein